MPTVKKTVCTAVVRDKGLAAMRSAWLRMANPLLFSGGEMAPDKLSGFSLSPENGSGSKTLMKNSNNMHDAMAFLIRGTYNSSFAVL